MGNSKSTSSEFDTISLCIDFINRLLKKIYTHVASVFQFPLIFSTKIMIENNSFDKILKSKLLMP